MNILLLEDGETHIATTDSRAIHVRKVLRLSVGDHLRAGIVDGPLGTATILNLDGSGLVVSFEPDDPHALRRPSASRRVSLILGHPRPIVLRRMLKDLATVGVDRLVVVPTQLGEKSYLKSTIWNDIRPRLIDGAAQAGSTALMQASCEATLADGLAAIADEEGSRVVLEPGSPANLEASLADRHAAVLAIGSERGWTPAELGVLHGAGFVSASLGSRILRTEIAALVACWAARTLPGVTER